MPKKQTGADRYFARRAKDPQFQRAYAEAREHIDAIDRIIQDLDEARTRAGISKAELARRANMAPEAVRRIFAARRSNPTLDTLVRLASAANTRLELRAPRKTSAPRRAKKQQSASA